MTTEIQLAQTLKIWSRFVAVIPNFYLGHWECDLFTLNKTGFTAEYEIKKSKADFENDFKKVTKTFEQLNAERWEKQHKQTHQYKVPVNWETQGKHGLIKNGKRTNYFWFVLPEELAVKVEIPKYAGLITFQVRENYGRIVYEFKKVKRAPLLHRNKTDYPKKGIMNKVILAYYHRGNIIPRRKRTTTINIQPEFPELKQA